MDFDSKVFEPSSSLSSTQTLGATNRDGALSAADLDSVLSGGGFNFDEVVPTITSGKRRINVSKSADGNHETNLFGDMGTAQPAEDMPDLVADDEEEPATDELTERMKSILMYFKSNGYVYVPLEYLNPHLRLQFFVRHPAARRSPAAGWTEEAINDYAAYCRYHQHLNKCRKSIKTFKHQRKLTKNLKPNQCQRYAWPPAACLKRAADEPGFAELWTAKWMPAKRGERIKLESERMRRIRSNPAKKAGARDFRPKVDGLENPNGRVQQKEVPKQSLHVEKKTAVPVQVHVSSRDVAVQCVEDEEVMPAGAEAVNEVIESLGREFIPKKLSGADYLRHLTSLFQGKDPRLREFTLYNGELLEYPHAANEEEATELLRNTRPVRLVFTQRYSRHHHGLCWAMKMTAVMEIKRNLSGLASHHGRPSIDVFDVGTAACAKHFLHKSGNRVHGVEMNSSGYMTVTAKHDQSKRYANYTSCDHSSRTCNCVGKLDVVTFIHSLNDSDPTDVAEVISKHSKLKVAFAIAHIPTGSQGTLAKGECSYQRKVVDGETTYLFWVKGNARPYENRDLGWVLQSHSSDVYVNGEAKVLCWKLREFGPGTYLIQFALVEQGVVSDVANVIEDIATFRGYTQVEPGTESELGVPEDLKLVAVDARESLIQLVGTDKTVYVPRVLLDKGLLHLRNKEINDRTRSALTAHLTREGKYLIEKGNLTHERLAEGMATLVHMVLEKKYRERSVNSKSNSYWAIRRRKKYNASVKLLDEQTWWTRLKVSVNVAVRFFVVAVAVLAAFRFLPAVVADDGGGQPADPVQSFKDDVVAAATVCLAALLLWNLRSLVTPACTVGGSIVIGLGAVILSVLYYSAIISWWIIKLLTHSLFLSLTLAFICLAYGAYRNQDYAFKAAAEFKLSVEEMQVIPDLGSFALPSGFTIKKFESFYPYVETVKENAKVFLGKLGNAIQGESRPGVEASGLVFDAAVPICSANSKHNKKTTVFTRIVVDTPVAKKGAWAVAEKLCGKVFEPTLWEISRNMFKGKILTDEELFTIYVDRFPKNKRLEILEAKKRVDAGEFGPLDLNYSCFIKWEKMLKLTRKGYEEFKPRPIAGVSDVAKAIAGPFFYQYGAKMKELWHYQHHIFYASGITNDELTGWARYHTERLGPVTWLYSDLTKYDSTQGPDCIQNENNWYRTIGFGRTNAENLVLKSKYKSTLYFGPIRVNITGMRKSGDNDTSTGNSRNTVIIMLNILFNLSPELLDPENIAMAVLGDDNVVMIRRAVAERLELDYEKVVNAAKSVGDRLGVIVKIGMSVDPIRAEFLSKRWYPTADGLVAGVKPGRVMAKMGYCLAKNCKKPLEQFHGALQSMTPTMAHVPFARVYLEECLKWLEDRDVAVASIDKHDAERRSGRTHQCDAETWAAFYELYGLCEWDEEQFRIGLVDHLCRYGLPSLYSSDEVASMLEVDFAGL